MDHVAVLNAGGWGTTLACVLARNGHRVQLWARRSELAGELRSRRENRTYLPGIQLPAAVEPTADLAAAVEGASIVVVAAPMQALRDLARRLARLLRGDAVVLSGVKGIESESWRRPTQVLAAELGAGFRGQLAALAGPNLAQEIARGLPTASVIACADATAARTLQELLGSSRLRVYTSADVVGVELCAAAKNTIAIAAGIADGLGCGDNAKAALITRSLSELGRLVAAHGGETATVAGLAGIGDLVATCTSRQSRNRWAGEELGRGRTVPAVVAATPMVVEGIPATRGVVALARSANVELPICEAVYRVLYEAQPPAAAIEDLLARTPTAEAPYAR